MLMVTAPCSGWFDISVARTQTWESLELSTIVKSVRFGDPIIILKENKPADTAPG